MNWRERDQRQGTTPEFIANRTGPRARTPASRSDSGATLSFGHRQWCVGNGLYWFSKMINPFSEILEPADR